MTAQQPVPPAIWTNWAKNQTSTARRIVTPSDDREVAAAVAEAHRSRRGIRAIGSGHSFTPVVTTDDTLLDLSRLNSVLGVDPVAGTATVRAGTRLHDLGEPLWNLGFSLKNQGDWDTQTISGATATGTKGSGIAYGTISSCIVGAKLVDGRGQLVEITDEDPDLLHAVQVSLGLLGVITELTLSVAPAYRIRESNAIMSLDELFDAWDSMLQQCRHFSFFWAPDEHSHEFYGLPPIPADHCYVKMLHEVEVDPATEGSLPPISGDPGQREGRAYLAYPDVETEEDSAFIELEQMVSWEDGRAAFLGLRDLMRREFPNENSPVQLRWQAADEALLSAQHRRNTVSVSVSGMPGGDWSTFLHRVDLELQRWDARPHWGKMHYLTAERVRALYPELDRFLELRRQFDPEGIFLNDHFRELFEL